MSVFDEPMSSYGNFKKMAEVGARGCHFTIVRPGTLLGAEPNMPYRRDLGLHIIAWREARAHPAWVNPDVQRHIVGVARAANDVCNALEGAFCPAHLSDGRIYFRDIVPPTVKRENKDPEEVTYSCSEGTLCHSPTGPRRLYADLVTLIREQRASPI